MGVDFASSQGRDCLVLPARVEGIILAMEQFESVVIREGQLGVGICENQVRSNIIVPATNPLMDLDSLASESDNGRVGGPQWFWNTFHLVEKAVNQSVR